MSVDVSPDGETLVFDLLGDIYQLPINGGEATALTAGVAWDQAPRFSPDGAYIYFLSDRVGYKNLWRLRMADELLQQVTHLDSDILGGPNWSQDGSRLLAGVVVGEDTLHHETVLHSINPTGGAVKTIAAPSKPLRKGGKRVRERARVLSGVLSNDSKVYYSELHFSDDNSRAMARLYVYDEKSQTRTAITPTGAAYHDMKPQLSRDGNRLAYFRQYADRSAELRILNRKTGEEGVLANFESADDMQYAKSRGDSRPNYAFTPDDGSVVFWHDGKIHRVGLDDRSMDVLPFKVFVEREVTSRIKPKTQRISDDTEASVIRWPSLSQDARKLAFTAIGYVWVMDMQSGEVRRLTDSAGFEYMPAISPDGRTVAYIGFALSDGEYTLGRLMVADVDGGMPKTLLDDPGADYLLPHWSQDGSMIALVRELDRRKGILAEYGWTPAAKGEFRALASATEFSDWGNWSIYARSVSFDATNDRLLMSYPRSTKEVVLVAVDLASRISRTLATGTVEVGGITPAPDLGSLALTRRDGTVWVVPFDESNEPVAVSTLAPDAHKVSESAGYYADWSNYKRLTFGFGKNVYRYNLGDHRLEQLRVSIPLTRPTTDKPIALTGARLITVSDNTGVGPVIESGVIVVSGRRIVEIGQASRVDIPSDAVLIDATGKTIIPGLLDTHYHNFGRGFSALVLPKSGPGFSDESAVKSGITSAWSPAGSANDGVPVMVDLQMANRVVGPRWSHSASGGVGTPYEFLTDYDMASRFVRERHELGVAVLKEYNAPTREQRRWLSTAARERGLGIVSHLEDLGGTMTRIVDGYTGGDHAALPVPFYKDVRELLRRTGFIWTPNITITRGLAGEAEDNLLFYCEALIQKQETGDPKTVEVDSLCDLDAQSPSVSLDTHRAGRVARQAAVAASNGAVIGVSAHHSPGSNLHQEMWYLWKGGMPIADVLRATTMNNAKKLGLQEEIGSLEAGKIADFLVLDENPLDDILNTLSIRYTVQGGVIYDSKTAKRLDASEIAVEPNQKTLH